MDVRQSIITSAKPQVVSLPSMQQRGSCFKKDLNLGTYSSYIYILIYYIYIYYIYSVGHYPNTALFNTHPKKFSCQGT